MVLNVRYIGIDGGGTKTTCVIGTSSGEILALASGDSSNIQSKPLPEVVKLLTGLMEEVMYRSGSDFTQLKTVYMSLAGAARLEDKEKITQALGPWKSDYPVELVIENDAKAALAVGAWDETGIVLIAGTGSIVYAFPSSGEAPTRIGGWGYLLGDEGSGFDIGRNGISAVLKAYDGRGTSTQMTGLLLETLECDHPTAIISAIYGADNVRSRIAGLSKVVFKAAANGDTVAQSILENATEQLVLLVEGAYEDLPKSASHSLVVGGGLFQNNRFKKNFDKAIQNRMGRLTSIYPAMPPVIGAYILALKNGDEATTTETKAIVENSWAILRKGDVDISEKR